MKQSKHINPDLEWGDEPECNRSGNRTIHDVLDARYGRRGVLRAGMAAAAVGVFSSTATEAEAFGFPGHGYGWKKKKDPELELNFDAIPTSGADEVIVPEGYVSKAFLPWGTPICGTYPLYQDGGLNSGSDQEQQVGMHHDGMTYFPLGRGHKGRQHGILCINHEYIDPNILHPNGQTYSGGVRTVPDEVRKEIAAHGVSVVEVRKSRRDGWEVVRGRYNRRITGGTPMELTGTVRGTDFVKTKYSPNGTMARGTINNCANGETPWNTYLTCEENWAGYFFNSDAVQPREQTRYGVPSAVGRYGWGTISSVDEYDRFNASTRGAGATDDYRNEPNTMGWVVEIDPFDPYAKPKKHTALGRFAHECASLAPVREGEPVVAYMGDDARFEYVYKFVSKGRYSCYREHKNRRLLEEGTLYVARFNDDGSGDWIALEYGKNGLTPANGFNSQADILVNTRLAADHVGATPMDRPEWSSVHPETRMVYITMTNNTRRGEDETDAANPRGPNPFGHIIRWQERHSKPWATSFDWDIFALAGPEEDSAVATEEGYVPLSAEKNTFSSPDGLWFDNEGLLWIETDGNDVGGNDMMLAAVPETGEIRRFMTGVQGCEVTGLAGTPDRTTLFANLQHPGNNNPSGSSWPDGPGRRPRSGTVVIERVDGGVVGGEKKPKWNPWGGRGWNWGWGWGRW